MNILEALQEINEKGTLQEQSEKLCDKLYCYKKLIGEYNVQMQNIDDMELLEELFEMRSKYKIRLSYIKREMCLLNIKIIDTIDTLEEIDLEFDDFVEVFKLNDDEIDEEESFYSNLMMSSNNIGQVVRTGIIESEKYLIEMIDED